MAAAAAFSVSPAMAAARHESIDVRLRHGYPICAGFCPNFTMTVSPSGEVISRSLFDGTIDRYRVGRRRLAAFRRILETVRPAGDRQLDVSCRRLPKGDPDPLADPRPNDLEVRWSGPTTHARLASCGYSDLSIRAVVERAVTALGANLLDGRKERSR